MATGRTLPQDRFLRRLLWVCLATMACSALPLAWIRFTWLGYPCLFGLMMVGLARRPPWQGAWGKRAYLALGTTSIVALILWVFNPRELLITGLPLLALLLLFTGWSLARLLRRLARETPMEGDLFAGALAGYLLLGIHGGLVLTLIDGLVPGSFRDTATGAVVHMPSLASSSAAITAWDLNVHRILYFSFVSLTTVGYGDIAPVEPLARLASVALSVLGPFYIAVVIGVVVSRYIETR